MNLNPRELDQALQEHARKERRNDVEATFMAAIIVLACAAFAWAWIVRP